MPRSIARPSRLLVLLAAAVAVAAVLVWQLSGGDDERAAVAGLPGVRQAADDGEGGLLVSLDPEASVKQVTRVLGELADESEATVVSGRASLDPSEESPVPDEDAARMLIAAGSVDARGGSVALEEGSGEVSVRAAPRRALDSPALARLLVLALADRGRWPESLESLTVAPVGVPVGREPVLVAEPAISATKLAALLDAAAKLRRERPRVVVNVGNVELRVLAEGPGDAGAAWDALASRVLPVGGFDDADAYVDVPGGGPGGSHPVLSGRLASDPDGALALLARLTPRTSRAFATTDFGYVEAEIAGPSAIEPLANAVGSAPGPRPVSRLKLEWGGGIGGEGGEVEDSPARVAELGPGIAAAARSGLDVAWSHRPGDSGSANLGLRGPARLRGPAIGSLVGHPEKLRQLAATIREIAWPGTAGFEVSLGNGTCEDLPTVAAVVAVDSTSDGLALTVRQSNDCSSEEAVAAVRRAWNATATAGAPGS